MSNGKTALLLLVISGTCSATGLEDAARCGSGACPLAEGNFSDGGDLESLLALSKLRRSAAHGSHAGAPSSASPCRSGFQSIPDVIACLHAVPMKPHFRKSFQTTLNKQLLGLYRYGGLVRNSSDNDAKLAPCYDFKVHRVALEEQLREVGHLVATSNSLGEVGLAMENITRQMRDSHIGFTPPWTNSEKGMVAAFAPFKFHLSQQNGAMVVKLLTNEGFPPIEKQPPSAIFGKAVTQINGQPAMKYLDRLVENWGNLQSRGARLNDLLASDMVVASPLIPPDEGVLKLEFEDGQSVETAWVGVMTPLNASISVLDDEPIDVEELTRVYSFDPIYEAIAHSFGGATLPTSDDWTARPVLRRSGAPAGAKSPSIRTPGAEPCRPRRWSPPGSRRKARRAGAVLLGVIESNSSSDSGDGNASDLPTNCTNSTHWMFCDDVEQGLKIWATPGSDLVVSQAFPSNGSDVVTTLKISTFVNTDSLDAWAAMLQLAVEKAAEDSDGQLVLDVIGNGGGSVALSAQASQYLFGGFPGYQESMNADMPDCPWFSRLLGEPLQHLLDMRKKVHSNPDHSFALMMKKSAKKLTSPGDSMLKYLQGKFATPPPGVLQCSGSSPSGQPVDKEQFWGCQLRGYMDAFLADHVLQGETSQSQRQFESYHQRAWVVTQEILITMHALGTCRRNRNTHEMCFSSFVSVLAQLESSQFQGIFQDAPFPPSQVFPERDPSVPLTVDWLGQTRAAVNGGIEQQVSPWITFSCPGFDVAGPMPNLPAHQTELKSIRILTDGTCGSACSIFITNPYLKGVATVVTMGGYGADSVDISSFEANVRKWDAMWPRLSALEYLYSVLSGGEPESLFLPLPGMFNTQIITFATGYPASLGPTSLPREWYLIPAPASHYIPYWPSADLGNFMDAGVMPVLLDLYKKTLAMPLKPLEQCDSGPR